MSLEKRIGGTIDKTREYLSSQHEDMVNYLKKNKLSQYFTDISPEEYRVREGKLAEYVGASVAKYNEELNGKRKLITKPAMAAAFLNDVYSLVSKAPFGNFSALSYVLFGAKTLAELPSMYRYMKKSHDWYGALEWTLMKPVNYVLPFVGPALESGMFERIVKRRAMYEAKNRFLQSLGYDSEQEKAKKILQMPLKDKLIPLPMAA